MPTIPFPDNALDAVVAQSDLIVRSYRRWFFKNLVDPKSDPVEQARALFDAPRVVAASDNSKEPRLTYGNRKALELWELSWNDFVKLPSKQTAEPIEQAARAQFLEEVRKNGFVTGYSGVRISSKGRRFWIRKATVWNLIGENGECEGQAVVFDQWDYV